MSDDAEFVFDAVVGFLTSPIWNVPVLTFIEQNCLVFDPDAENRDNYKEIHEKYKSMVETLLASVLKDFGITEEQFMKACSRSSEGSQPLNSVNKEIFEQMWAADDFEVFKRLMIQKNIELQLQALHLIQQRNNVLPPSMVQGGIPPSTPAPTGSKVVGGVDDEEDAIMQEVLRKSKEEYEMQQKSQQAPDTEMEKSLAHSVEESERLMKEAKHEQEELEKALKTSLENQTKAASEAEPPRDEVVKGRAKAVTKEAKKTDTNSAKTVPKQTSLPAIRTSKASSKTAEPSSVSKPGKEQILPKGKKPAAPAKQEKSPASSDAASSWLSSAKAEATAAASSSPAQQASRMTEEELARRTEYLKQQRDKLLELKKQERQKRLVTYTEKEPKARPTSARAARRVTDGQEAEPQASGPPSEEDKEKKLAMRRALAKCLRQEVVDKN